MRAYKFVSIAAITCASSLVAADATSATQSKAIDNPKSESQVMTTGMGTSPPPADAPRPKQPKPKDGAHEEVAEAVGYGSSKTPRQSDRPAQQPKLPQEQPVQTPSYTPPSGQVSPNPPTAPSGGGTGRGMGGGGQGVGPGGGTGRQ